MTALLLELGPVLGEYGHTTCTERENLVVLGIGTLHPRRADGHTRNREAGDGRPFTE